MPESEEQRTDEDIQSVVARLQSEKSDITANGYRMGKHVDLQERDLVKLLPQTWEDPRRAEREKRMEEMQSAYPHEFVDKSGLVVAAVVFIIFLAGRAAGVW